MGTVTYRCTVWYTRACLSASPSFSLLPRVLKARGDPRTYLLMKSVIWAEMRGCAGKASCALRMFSYTTKGALPLKGSSPNTHMYRHTPSAHMSSCGRRAHRSSGEGAARS